MKRSLAIILMMSMFSVFAQSNTSSSSTQSSSQPEQCWLHILLCPFQPLQCIVCIEGQAPPPPPPVFVWPDPPPPAECGSSAPAGSTCPVDAPICCNGRCKPTYQAPWCPGPP